jgi:hypothetical protein
MRSPVSIKVNLKNLKTFIHWLRCIVTKAELLP